MDKFEAAQVLKCSPRRVAELCKTGVIRAKKPGKSWVISETAIEDYLNRDDNPKREGVAVVENEACQSTAGVIPFGSISQRRAAEGLKNHLARLTGSQRKRPTTR